MPFHACLALFALLFRQPFFAGPWRARMLSQATSSKTKFETEIDNKNTQLKHSRDEVEDMMVAIEVTHAIKGMCMRMRTQTATLLLATEHATTRADGWWPFPGILLPAK